jgi:DNA polymerase-3 subunit epsilon
MFYLGRKELQAEPSLGAGSTQIKDWPEHFHKRAETAKHAALREYYAAGIPGPDTPLSDVPLIAMDFETTDLDPINGGIVSIGIVPMTIRRIKCSQSRHWILKPRAKLTAESIVLHGITHSDIERAPDLIRILPTLLQHLQGKVVVAHHRGIERLFLNTALKARLGEGIDFPIIDTMELEARIHRRRALGFWDSLLGRKQVSIRLTESRGRYNLPLYRPHNALSDALACAELLQAQVADRFSPDTPVSEIWA